MSVATVTIASLDFWSCVLTHKGDISQCITCNIDDHGLSKFQQNNYVKLVEILALHILLFKYLDS